MKSAHQKVLESKQYKKIMGIVKKYRFVWEREDALHKAGFTVDTYPMGSGGVGQVNIMADHVRIQIGYGVGKHNYAKAVRL